MGDIFDDMKDLELDPIDLESRSCSESIIWSSPQYLKERDRALILGFAKVTVEFLKSQKQRLDVLHGAFAKDNQLKGTLHDYAYHKALQYVIKNIDIFPEVLFPQIAFLPFGEDKPNCFQIQFPFYKQNEQGIVTTFFVEEVKNYLSQFRNEEGIILPVMKTEAIMIAIMNIIPDPNRKQYIKTDTGEEVSITYENYGDWDIEHNGETMRLDKFLDKALSGKL